MGESMEALKELVENLDLEEFDYYYHITGKGYGDEILENGLYLKENDLKTTMIKLPDEMLSNPCKYCEGEYRNGIVKRQEMVLIGCYKDEGNNIIHRADIPKREGDQVLNYLVRSENILGYIDLASLELVYNPEYIDFNYRR